MDKRGSLLLVSLMLLVVSAGPMQAGELSFFKALAMARKGPVVLEAESVVLREEASELAARSVGLPHVELTASDRMLASDPGFVIPRWALGNPVELPLVAGDRHVWSANLKVEQLLWNAGLTHHLEEASLNAVEAARARKAAVQQAVDLVALKAFEGVILASQLVDVAEHSVKEYRALVNEVTALVENHQLPLADKLQAEAALEGARFELAKAEAARRTALAALQELIGSRVDAVIPIPSVPEDAGEETEDEWVKLALERRRDITALEAAARALKARKAAAIASSYPALVAVAGAERVDDSYRLHKDNASVALALKFDIFDGGQTRAEVYRLDAEAKRIQHQVEAMRRRIEREVRQAYARLQSARKQLNAAKAAKEAAEEALRLAKLRYSEELITNRELLDAQADAVRARRNEVIAETSLAASWLELRIVAGEDLLATKDEATPPNQQDEK